MENSLAPDVPEIEVKKKYLRRFKKNRAQIRRLKIKVANLDQMICRVKSPNYSGMPRGGTPISIEELLSDKQEYEERIRQLEKTGRQIKREIAGAIDSLEDSSEAEVLEGFFLECKEFGDIADDTEYSLRHVIRLYTQGIENIEICH